MPHKNESHGGTETHDDDIIRWFQALPPPHAGQVSPHLRARVLAQIDQRRAGGRLWPWRPWAGSPAWRTVCAAAMLLSLSVNIWWGLDVLGRRTHAQSPSPPLLSTDTFQQDLQDIQAFGTAVPLRSGWRAQGGGLGFVPEDMRRTFVRLGTVYTDALAGLRSGARETAAQQVDLLSDLLEQVQAPAVLAAYLHQVQLLLHHPRDAGASLTTFLALFEALYAAAYTQPQATEAWTLFHLGAWLENMALAAQAGDTVVLRQAGALEHFRTTLTALQVPPVVLHALDQLHQLVAAEALTDSGRRTILQLVHTMQQTFGVLPE